jgi:NAD(P)-dependent dehydrogenase (short-subunit alcohol dehydrogenase family)
MLQAGRGGSLVAVSSIMAKLGQPRMQPYAASKGSIGGLVRAAAAELGPHGIRVNAVLPGYVETPLAAGAISHAPWADATLPRIPLGRWGQPADIAGIVVYLASPASRWHTGSEIVVDGGYSVSG